ncbi:zf-HC2 domain-containing protein [Psychrobacillus sp. OK032]|uniref:zf-HC2 domain-containing protein n=1 Tax=Psychrobacillus sp. OK032 TaxID=1884358 RepID=UPI0008D694E6|nr:zf-HC2 domain-containing protein [Psychrobacillus sp. OK032]SES46730.1 Putative zinc-finger [Psychrobacillus sp. OK032]
MTKIQCSVIRDLLPLYYDGVCSDETKKLVEEHIASCNECKTELESLNVAIEIPMLEIQNRNQDQKVIRSMAYSLKKLRKKALYKGVGITAMVGLFIFCGYYALFLWNIQSVDSENFKISDIFQLNNGHIVYSVDFLDEYDVLRVKYSLVEDGNFYMIPLRPIVKQKTEHPIGDVQEEFILQAQQENWNNQEIHALYYGSPDDAVLIWEKGMELPKASAEMERKWDMSRFK